MSTGSKSHYTIVWKVKNFLSCYQMIDNYIESPTFHIDELIVKEWNILLYPRLQKNLHIYLMRRRPDTVSESLVINFRIEVVDICGKILKCKEFQNRKMEKNDGILFSLLSSKELFEKITGWSKDTLTVRCSITLCEEPKYQEVRYEAVTVFDIDRCIFKRKCTNSAFADWTGDIIFHNSKSPDFKFIVNAPDNDLKIYIQVLKEIFLQKPVVIRLNFINDIGIKIASKCEMHVFKSMGTWMFPTFISKKELSHEDAINSIFKYTLFAECSVSKLNIARANIQKYTVNLFVESVITQEREIYILPFQKDFQGLYMSEKYSDVKLLIGNKEIFAHKAVLGTRSPVFSAMFDQNMLENQTGVVNIKEMDEETTKQLLEFMYTDKVSEMDYEIALKLLLASDRYQVLALKEKCCSFIKSSLSVENVCEVIAVSDLIGSESLKKLSLEFICANIPGVLNAPNWLLLFEKNVRLGTEIVCNISEYMKHESVEKSC